MNENFYLCPICGRITPNIYLEKHHLIPRSKGGKSKDTVNVCIDCGDMVHKVINLNDLRDLYNTVEKIRSHERIQTWIEWIQKRPHKFGVNMKKKKSRRG